MSKVIKVNSATASQINSMFDEAEIPGIILGTTDLGNTKRLLR